MELTLFELRTMLDHARELLETHCGYDTVNLPELIVREVGLTLSVYVMDKAQEDLDYNARYETGHLYFYFDEPQELWAAIRAKPSREQRELHQLLRITAALGQSTAHIRSAQAQAFAREIIAAGEKYRNLLGSN